MEPSATEYVNSQRSDEELENLAESGDFASAKELFARYYYSTFMPHALHICKDEKLAEDSVQEAYLRFACKFVDFRRPYKFVAWIKGIISNVIREEWRHRKKIGTDWVPKDISNIEDRKHETPGEKLDRRDFEICLENLSVVVADLDQYHQQISEIYRNAYQSGHKPPSPDLIAEKVGISRRSVYRYRDTIEKRWNRLFEERGFDAFLVAKILGKNEPV